MVKKTKGRGKNSNNLAKLTNNAKVNKALNANNILLALILLLIRN